MKLGIGGSGMSRLSEWWDRTNEKIARRMYPAMYEATDSMREMSEMIRGTLEEMGVDVDVELEKIEDPPRPRGRQE